MTRGTDFLRRPSSGETLEVGGQRVVVMGGGNVAMDAARTALRLKAASVQVLSLESLRGAARASLGVRGGQVRRSDLPS